MRDERCGMRDAPGIVNSHCNRSSVGVARSEDWDPKLSWDPTVDCEEKLVISLRSMSRSVDGRFSTGVPLSSCSAVGPSIGCKGAGAAVRGTRAAFTFRGNVPPGPFRMPSAAGTMFPAAGTISHVVGMMSPGVARLGSPSSTSCRICSPSSTSCRSSKRVNFAFAVEDEMFVYLCWLVREGFTTHPASQPITLLVTTGYLFGGRCPCPGQGPCGIPIVCPARVADSAAECPGGKIRTRFCSVRSPRNG